MNIDLKPYQQTAIDELVESISALLGKGIEKKVCIFQSPTGSGKTVVVAKFIERLIKDLPDDDLCFLWISIGKGDLHKQSKKSLENIFDGFPKCVLVEDEFSGSRSIINQNEVVVVNWEKLRSKERETGEWKSKLMRVGETVNLIEVLESTKQKRKIILIIDESHYASDTDRTNELREIVNADVTLEMSATPKIFADELKLLRTMPSPVTFNNESSVFVWVDPTKVIEQGMIKKELIINQDLDTLADDEMTSQEVILKAAYQKRLEQKSLFEDISSKINPLCLIQLPNAEEGAEKKESITAFLKERDITEANGKLAVWLSEEKSDTLDEISKNDNEIEFLIFKQAIDTGWDCPRASILVKLRETQSYTFEVQTVGRILRMPEWKHYDSDVLDIGNIYTNLTSITVKKEDYNPNLIKHIKAVRKAIYENVELTSYYKSRVDYGDITRSFGPLFDTVLCKELGLKKDFALFKQNVDTFLAKGLIIDVDEYSEPILENILMATDKFDEIIGELGDQASERLRMKLSDADILGVFNQVIKSNLNGFAPKRSIPNVRGAIYQWFRNYLGISPQVDDGAIRIQRIFLNPTNVKVFSRLLGQATGEYRPIKKAEVRGKIKEENYDWEVKKEEFYNENSDANLPYELCIYDPCYLSLERSSTENAFEKHLELQGERIEWWFKNGESMRDYFGIKYEEFDMPQTFYPDYIIKFKSGKVGIFDTKAGQTAKDSALKAEVLQKYIVEQNKAGKKLIGGIVVRDRTGDWRCNDHAEYSFDPNDLTTWAYFDKID